MPITFLDKFYPEQFEILGISGDCANVVFINNKRCSGRFYVDKKRLYDRILIKKK